MNVKRFLPYKKKLFIRATNWKKQFARNYFMSGPYLSGPYWKIQTAKRTNQSSFHRRSVQPCIKDCYYITFTWYMKLKWNSIQTHVVRAREFVRFFFTSPTNITVKLRVAFPHHRLFSAPLFLNRIVIKQKEYRTILVWYRGRYSYCFHLQCF